MKSILALLALTTLLFGCAQKEEKTPLKVSIGAISGSNVWTGGLVIAGASNDGRKFVKQVGSNDELLLEIPNGTWRFMAIGWDGSNAFEGNSFCDHMANINLQGEQVDLTMTATKAKCSNAAYGGHANATGFFPLTLNTCIDIKPYLQQYGATAVPEGLACDDSDDDFAGDAKSFKLVIPQNVFGAGGAPLPAGEIISTCYNVTSGQASTNMKLPYGTTNNYLPYIIQAYPSAGCSGTVQLFVYDKGLSQVAQNYMGGATPNTTAQSMDLYMHSDICSPTQQAKSPFAAGSTSGGHYLICTGAQFSKIAFGSTAPCDGAMGCEANAVYSIGKNIDLTGVTPGTTAYIMNDFEGELYGNGFTISNGTKPLFENIQNPISSTNKRHAYENLVISNFTINFDPGSNTSNLGIFANNVAQSGTSVNLEFRNIKVSANSSISLNRGTSQGYLGGLIGYVNQSSGAKRTEIRDNEQLADVSTTTTDFAAMTGGLVGKIAGPASGGNNTVRVKFNSVGKLRDNPQDETYEISITGKKYVGGLIGYMDDAEIGMGNDVLVAITAVNMVGGLAGAVTSTNTSTRVQSSAAELTFSPSATAARVGGAVGEVIGGGNIYIDGTISELLIESTTTQVDRVGGIVGNHDITGTSGLQIQNARANIVTYSDGQNYGGFVGRFVPTATSGFTNIDRSTVTGTIGANNSTNAANTHRAGMIGSASYANSRMNIVDMTITATNNAGGMSGGTTLAIFEENYVDTTITLTGTTNLRVSGGIAEATTDDTGPNIIRNKVNTAITLSNSAASCDTAVVACGLLVGRTTGINSTSGFTDNNIVMGTITKSNGSQQNIDCGYAGGGACSIVLGTDILNNYNLDNSTTCTGLSGEPYMMYNSLCQPLFYAMWKEYGWDSANSFFRAGSEAEPFKISTPAKWNDINEDFFLMSKSFELTANLDFSTISTTDNITPIGGNNNAFKGKLIPNGYKIISPARDFDGGSNYCGITGIPGSPTLNNCGLFGVINGAQIGYHHDPLIIEYPTFDFDGVTSGGIIGSATSSHLNIRVKHAEYSNAGTNTNVGGIVGLVNNSVSINYSSFHGILNLGNTNYVGGLVGTVATNTGDLKIYKSFVDLSSIIPSSAAGGFIGYADESTAAPVMDISSSYLKFSISSNTEIDATKFGGAIGNLNTGMLTMTHSFMDFTNLNNNGVITSDIVPFIGSTTSGDVGINNSSGNSSVGLVGNYSTPTDYIGSTTLIEESAQVDLAVNHPDIFETDSDWSTWYLDGSNNLKLYWEAP